MKDTSVGIPADKTGKLGTWGIGNYAQYRYDLFNRSDRFSGPWYGKTFRNIREADPEIFSAIDDYKPNGTLPFLLGKKEDAKNDHLLFECMLERNTLVAGMTRSGKTNWLRSMAVTLLHYSHPEYLRMVVLDPKAAAFKSLGNVVNVVNQSFEEIAETILKLDKVMKKRIELTGVPNLPEDAKSMNAYAYKYRIRSKLMPYIVVIFDEFAQFSIWAQKNNQEALIAIESIAAMGLGVGINFIFATQSPYKEFIKGYIKANFENNICFKVRNFNQETLILGAKGKYERSAASLKKGQFMMKINGLNTVYNAVFCSQDSFENATRNWEQGGFNYKLF